MSNPAWNCPRCGSRVAIEGNLSSNTALRCSACGQLQTFQRLEDLCLYEDRILALQKVQPLAESKNLAREAMLSMQCSLLVH
jgi:transcription elongation factor Elf1